MTAVALADVGWAVLVWVVAVVLLLAGMHAIPDDPRNYDTWRESTWAERREVDGR
jgi:hypothetical protein